MIPNRVFSPLLTIKSLTSENCLKGNSQQLNGESSNSNSGTIKKHPPTATKAIDFIKEIASIDNNTRRATNEHRIKDKDIPLNKCTNELRHKSDGAQVECEHLHCNTASCSSQNASKLNNAQIEKIIDNLIGTQETEIQVNENRHRNHIGNDAIYYVGQGNEPTDRIGLSVKKFVAETTINNVPLRDVIQRKVSKFSNQLLHSNKESSIKSTTSTSTASTNNVSKTKKRSLFRRKTTAVTKDQIEAAKNLNKNNQITLHNKPIIGEKAQVTQTSNANDNNNSCKENDTSVVVYSVHESQHLQNEQNAVSVKQKQINNVTIATKSIFNKRKNTKTENKSKLNEVDRNKNNKAPATKVSQFNNIDDNDDDNNIVISATLNESSSTSKHYYIKQLPTENCSTQTKKPISESLDLKQFNEIHNINSNITKTKSKPPPYINPPSAANTNKEKSHNSSEIEKITKNIQFEYDIKNTHHLDAFNDEHGNYALPYEAIKNVCSTPTVTDSITHIRIANQLSTPSKVNLSVEKQTTNTNNQKTATNHILCRDNKDLLNDKSKIVCVYGKENVNECILFDTNGQSTSNSSDSNSSSIELINFNSSENDKITESNLNMDPTAITNLTSPCDMLTKPEFSSSHLQNIPVRPRKGIPHLENYCLFDPSKDFVNEKELKKKYGLVNGDCMPFPIKILDKRTNEDELMKETIYEDHDFVYDTLEDVKEEDEENIDSDTSFPNYFTIDPDYIEQNKMETMFGNANHLQPIVESETEDIYSDSNANLNKTNVYENQPSKRDSSVVVPLKKSPQIEKIVRQASQPIITTFAAKKMTSSKTFTQKIDSINSKPQSNKLPLKNRTKVSPPTDLPLRTNIQTKITTKKRNSMTMKHSVSTPQLSLKDLLADNAALPVVEIETKNTSTTCIVSVPVPNTNRLSQYKVRRPTSQHSDADSGFLSPVTPPDAFNQINSTFMQCDTIQAYIEVSNRLFFCYFHTFYFHSYESLDTNPIQNI